MGLAEDYYIRVNAEQRGPYSFDQLKRLYHHSFIAEDTLYWREGMEQWHPLVDLCGPSSKARKTKRGKRRILLPVILLLVAAVAALFAPTVIDGWKEINEHEFTPASAYWKARGFARDHLHALKATVTFDSFQATRVSMAAVENEVVVSLPCTIFPAKGLSARRTYKVAMQFDDRQHEWRKVTVGE